MVVFTCNYCGETLQKPKVTKHYEFRCRRTPFLTCMDCLKDFRKEEYVAHVKCVSEAERYGGKDYVAKSNANKGERKQQEWICVVGNLLNSNTDLSNEERNFLNILSRYENIPRKKTKFLNFVHNIMGNRMNVKVVESVWDKMESKHKESQESVKQIPNQDDTQTSDQINDNTTPQFQSKESNNLLDNQENIVENQNNENICRENGSLAEHGENEIKCKKEDLHGKRKSKKPKSNDAQVPEEDQPVAKIPKTSNSLQANDNSFDWKQNILDIVQAKKNEISLKKLHSKIIKNYSRHISNLHDAQNLSDEEREKAALKFNKALKKLKKSLVIHVSEDTVKLA